RLDFFVSFSSMAAYGIRGAAGYAYATAFQNAFARHRDALVARGLRSGKSGSPCWGPWVMGRHMPAARDAPLASAGLGLIDMEIALPVVERSIAGGEAVVGLMALGDRDRAAREMGVERSAPRPPSLGDRLAELEARAAKGETLAREEVLDL